MVEQDPKDPKFQRAVKRGDQLNVRISEHGRAVLLVLAQHYGISLGSVVEMLVRDRARDLQMRVNQDPATGKISVIEKDGHTWAASFEDVTRKKD